MGAHMNMLVLWGLALLTPLAWGQQVCLTKYRGSPQYHHRMESNSPIIFDKISTLGTTTIHQSLVDVSLANTTGEIKIKPVVESVCSGPRCEGSGEQFFYLSVKASKHPREQYSYPRSAQLFLLVNGKVPLRGLVTQYKMNGGRMQVERTHRVVGLSTDEDLGGSMPLGVLNIGDKEASFEAMDYIKHEDSLRVMTGELDDALAYVSVCIFWQKKEHFGTL